MQDQKALWKEIEQLQTALHETINEKGINSPEAVRSIQEFRNRMQEYHDLMKR